MWLELNPHIGLRLNITASQNISLAISALLSAVALPGMLL